MDPTEHFSSVDEVVQWIQEGPILQLPSSAPPDNPNVTCPPYAPLVPTAPPRRALDTTTESQTEVQRVNTAVPRHIENPACTSNTNHLPDDTLNQQEAILQPHQVVPTILAPRTSSRTRAPRDFLKPTHKGKVYSVLKQRSLSGKQRVPVTLTYPEKQRVSDLSTNVPGSVLCQMSSYLFALLPQKARTK
jgi:hypothetical protein